MNNLSDLCFIYNGRYYNSFFSKEYYYPASKNIITVSLVNYFINNQNNILIDSISSKATKNKDIWTKWIITFDQKNSFKLKFSMNENLKRSVKINISKEEFLDFLKKRYPEDFLAISFNLNILSGRFTIPD